MPTLSRVESGFGNTNNDTELQLRGQVGVRMSRQWDGDLTFHFRDPKAGVVSNKWKPKRKQDIMYGLKRLLTVHVLYDLEDSNVDHFFQIWIRKTHKDVA
jgi:hypothetical protein